MLRTKKETELKKTLDEKSWWISCKGLAITQSKKHQAECFPKRPEILKEFPPFEYDLCIPIPKGYDKGY